MWIPTEPRFGAPPDDVLDLLQESGGVGLQLDGHELAGR
jgi:hypothetical protein